MLFLRAPVKKSVVDALLDFVLKGRVVQLVLVELKERVAVFAELDLEDVRVTVVVVERVADDLFIVAEVRGMCLIIAMNCWQTRRQSQKTIGRIQVEMIWFGVLLIKQIKIQKMKLSS